MKTAVRWRPSTIMVIPTRSAGSGFDGELRNALQRFPEGALADKELGQRSQALLDLGIGHVSSMGASREP